MTKIVLHSIDSPRRDFEWRLYMARLLLDHGFASVIGGKPAIRRVHARSQNCIFLGRLDSNAGRSQKDQAYLKKMEDRDTALFFLHDEGALFPETDYSASVKRIYPYELFESPAFRKVFFWGEKQRQVIEPLVTSTSADKLKVTGAPRFDLCREKSQRAEKEPRPSYTLVCGRFALANKVQGKDPGGLSPKLLEVISAGYQDVPQQKRHELAQEFLFNNWRKITLEFSEFVYAIYRLATTFPDERFLIRPHPSEKDSTYTEAFARFDNIEVDKSGDAIPFISGAKAVIHSECTTGLEAAFCDKPVINLRPAAGSPELEPYSVVGVSTVGTTVRNADELCESYEKLKNNNFEGNPEADSVESHIYNTPSNPRASQLILEELSRFCEANPTPSTIKHGRGLRRVLALCKQFLAGAPLFKQAVATKDIKMYTYSEKEIRSIWKSFGGDPRHLRIEDGTVFVSEVRQ